jgi:hypothetical protein
MRKLGVILVIVLALIISLSSCIAPKDKILNSLGEYKRHEFYTEGAFQDYTDYNKYYFSSANLENNKYFSKVTEDDIAAFNEHLDDFESWIDTYRSGDPQREIVVNYDFDRSCIDTDDYYYISSEKIDLGYDEEIFANYDIYFYDTESNILYYFHNNI